MCYPYVGILQGYWVYPYPGYFSIAVQRPQQFDVRVGKSPPSHRTAIMLWQQPAGDKQKYLRFSSFGSRGTVDTPNEYMNDRSRAPSLR